MPLKILLALVIGSLYFIQIQSLKDTSSKQSVLVCTKTTLAISTQQLLIKNGKFFIFQWKEKTCEDKVLFYQRLR
jgi:hypothetical protein